MLSIGLLVVSELHSDQHSGHSGHSALTVTGLLYIYKCFLPLARFLLYVEEGDCIIKGSVERGRENVWKTILFILFTGIWREFFFYGFP